MTSPARAGMAETTACSGLINGRPIGNPLIHDRGFMYGDGVFRTVRVAGGRPLWWPAQLAKLRRDAQALGIPCPEDAVWTDDVSRLLDGRETGVLRLVLTRGEGPRGYRPPDGIPANRVASLAAFPAWMEDVARQGARMRLCGLRLAIQPRLAGIKHLNRLENVLARGEWDDPDVHEGLLLDADGRVIGGVSSNLFLLTDAGLLTPRLDRCGVAGVARERVMAAAGRLNLAVREVDMRLDDVFGAREVMLTNSLMGVWPVSRLEQQTWPAPQVAPALRNLLDD